MLVSEPASPTPHPTHGAPAKPAPPEHAANWDAAVKQADPKPGKPAVPVTADHLEFALEKKPVSSPPVEATGTGSSGATKPVSGNKPAAPVVTVERPPNPLEVAEAVTGAVVMASHAIGLLARKPTDGIAPFKFGKIPFGNLPIATEPAVKKVWNDPPGKNALPKVTLEMFDSSAHAGLIPKLGGTDSAGFVLLPLKGASGSPTGVTNPDGFTQVGMGMDKDNRFTIVGAITWSKKVVGGDIGSAQGKEGGFAKASGNRSIQATIHLPNGEPGTGKILQVDLTGAVGMFAQLGLHIPIAKAEPGKNDPNRVQAILGGYASGSLNIATLKLEWDGNKPDKKMPVPQPATEPAMSPFSLDTKDLLTGLMPMPKLAPASPSGLGKGQGVPAKSIEQTVADWVGDRNKTFVDNIQWIAEQLNDSLHEASKIKILPIPVPRIVFY